MMKLTLKNVSEFIDKNLIWNVYISDFKTNEILTYNVFEHWGFSGNLALLIKQYIRKKKKNETIISELNSWFEMEVKKNIMYYFWAKCEYEVVITDWPPMITYEEFKRVQAEFEDHNQKWLKEPCRLHVWCDGAKKVDVYDQLCLNWQTFIDYILQKINQ